MPRTPDYINVPAVIPKAGIAAYAALHGKANSEAIELNGVTYEPLTVRFATFAGEQLGDGMFHGVYQFEQGDFKDTEAADLATILSSRKMDKPRRQSRQEKPSEET